MKTILRHAILTIMYDFHNNIIYYSYMIYVMFLFFGKNIARIIKMKYSLEIAANIGIGS